MKGNVKFFNERKGFGFIAGEDGKDYFFHHTALKEGVSVGENDPVDFTVTDGDRGPKAVDVIPSGAGSAPADDMDDDSEDEREE